MDNVSLAWFNSVSGQLPAHFLETCPKSPTFTFSNKEFVVAIRRRLNLPIPEVVPDLRCTCKAHGIENPLIDERCNHLVTSCPKNGFGINLHNMVAFNLQSMFSACGIPSKCNQSPYLHAGDNFSVKDKKKKPDIMLNFNDGSRRKIAIDVSQTCPIPINNQHLLTYEEASIIGRASNERYNEKLDKYSLISNACGVKFIPIIFETTGRLHEDSLKFLDSILNDAIKGGYLNGYFLRRFWRKKIAVSYIKDQAAFISERLTSLNNSTSNDISAYENTDEFACRVDHMRY